MAEDTPISTRNLVFYEVFVRNHGPRGTLCDVIEDLPRIRSLGVDVLWLMPIHPVGRVNRKGALGSPYSVLDYRAIDPGYGTEVDYSALLEQAHDLGMKVILDIVFSHTAFDSPLADERPDWYHRCSDGSLLPASSDWTDVTSLRHPDPALAKHLIETLLLWVNRGVDGFRCDVASAVPLDFWIEARQAVAAVNPDALWLGESIHAAAVSARRCAGLRAACDAEMYRAFDVLYDYDIWSVWHAAVRGLVPVSRYLEMLRLQDSIYPYNYVKMRCVENHDQVRVMQLAPSRSQALAWTAFQAFNKGAFLIYAGQESGSKHRPSLFDSDPVQWNEYDLQPFLATLASIKKHPALASGEFVIVSAEPAIQSGWKCADSGLYGVFNVNGAEGKVSVPLPDGPYEDILTGDEHDVRDGDLALPAHAVILSHSGQCDYRPFFSYLLDYELRDD